MTSAVVAEALNSDSVVADDEAGLGLEESRVGDTAVDVWPLRAYRLLKCMRVVG